MSGRERRLLPRPKPSGQEDDDHARRTHPIPHRVYIFDTTLRDGEQSPGATMTLEEKLQVAELLDEMGVDIIEAGFPIASNGDFEAVAEIAKRSKNSVIAGLARAITADIDRAGEAVRHARRGRIHTFVSTSPIHLAHQMNKTEEEVLEIITRTVAQARNLIDDVEWSAMDATRTPIDFLARCIEAAIKAGATTINLPDTVGYAVPDEYEAMFRAIMERVPGADKVIFSTHCHNDLGLAVANSLAGVRGGARQVECTINGLGERAGNAALEEVVMAIRTRGDSPALPHRDRDDAPVARLQGRLGGLELPGAVQQGDRRQERLRPRERHPSGRHAQERPDLRDHDARERRHQIDLAGDGQAFGPRRLQGQAQRELGYDLGDNQFQEAFQRFKDLADRKKHVYDADIVALVDDEVGSAGDRIKLVDMEVVSKTGGMHNCDLTLSIDGEKVSVSYDGTGSVDAIFKAIKQAVGRRAASGALCRRRA